ASDCTMGLPISRVMIAAYSLWRARSSAAALCMRAERRLQGWVRHSRKAACAPATICSTCAAEVGSRVSMTSPVAGFTDWMLMGLLLCGWLECGPAVGARQPEAGRRRGVAGPAHRGAAVARLRLVRIREGGDDCFPLKPQRILRDLRAAMGREDILISDVSSHKLVRPARHLVCRIRAGGRAGADRRHATCCPCGRANGVDALPARRDQVERGRLPDPRGRARLLH